MIDDCDDVEKLTDDKLRTFLDKTAVNPTMNVTESELLNMLQKHMRMKMSVKSAKARMELLFVNYKSLFCQYGMAWVTKNLQKVAFRYLLSVIKPSQLKNRFERDNNFSKNESNDYFKAFLKHAVELSEAFKKIENENSRKRQYESGGGGSNTGSKTGPDSKPASKPSKNSGRKPPPSPCSLRSCKLLYSRKVQYARSDYANGGTENLRAGRALD